MLTFIFGESPWSPIITTTIICKETVSLYLGTTVECSRSSEITGYEPSYRALAGLAALALYAGGIGYQWYQWYQTYLSRNKQANVNVAEQSASSDLKNSDESNKKRSLPADSEVSSPKRRRISE